MRLPGVLILAVAVGLSGCKTNNASRASSEMGTRVTPAARSEATTVPLEADQRPSIICFGDSLTAGFGADVGASYPDYLQNDLDAAGYRYRVVNQGVSGNTTKDGIERLPGVVAAKPAVVVLEFGGNDGLRGLKVQNTRDNLATMIKTLEGAGGKVVLAGISLPPDYGADYVNTFTATYASLGREFHVPVMPFLLKDVYGVEGMMQEDRTHATAAGNKIVARNVMPYLTPLLKK